MSDQSNERCPHGIRYDGTVVCANCRPHLYAAQAQYAKTAEQLRIEELERKVAALEEDLADLRFSLSAMLPRRSA